MKCRDRHLFLEDTSKGKGHSPPNLQQRYSLVSCQQTHKFGLWLAKTHCYEPTVSLIFYVKHCRVMVIRRGDVTFIAWVFAGFEMNCLITSTGDVLICHLRFTTMCSGKPQINLGICRPDTRELSLLQFGRCNFLSDPCLFVCIFKEKVPIETFHISS